MTESLTKTVRVDCSVAHAFEIFTSRVDTWWPPGHRRLADSELTLEAREGGRFFERAASGEENLLGEVLSSEPPHRISFTWFPGSLKLPTRVDISFEQQDGLTLVTVTHSEADSALGDLWPERVRLFTRGWDHVLAAFANATTPQPSRCQ